jgi:diaminopimelate epimerase
MAILSFSKWQGTGNDFILIDDRGGGFPEDGDRLVHRLCDRHFGIGSDGLILLREPKAEGSAYHMEFFNPDASRSFCGNGSRCAYAFWCMVVKDQGAVRFTAIDGAHEARWTGSEVEVSMRDVKGMERIDETSDLIDTGSPHLVLWVDDPAEVDILPAAREHRYGARFKDAGVNVNFVRWREGRVEMRTYERGVEAETLSCGTGVTAAALSAMAREKADGDIAVRTPGGELHVTASMARGSFTDIRLRGPVRLVFQGTVELG